MDKVINQYIGRNFAFYNGDTEMLKVINAVTKERLYALKFEHSNYRPQKTMTTPSWLGE